MDDYRRQHDDWFHDVCKFHHKFDLFVGERPAIPDVDTQRLRVDLIDEEYGELLDALCDENLPEIADAAADLIYVVVGMCISFGIDLRDVWKVVQESNMSKTGGKGPNGKQGKGPDFRPPDIKRVLLEQGWIEESGEDKSECEKEVEDVRNSL